MTLRSPICSVNAAAVDGHEGRPLRGLLPVYLRQLGRPPPPARERAALLVLGAPPTPRPKNRRSVTHSLCSEL